MQSQRKNSNSYFGRQQSIMLHSSKSSTRATKKLSIGSQTENIPNFEHGIRLCNFSSMSMEEIKENYIITLSFLNCCHEFINKMFLEGLGGVKLEKIFAFKVPEVPNYLSLLEMFLDKDLNKAHQQNWIKRETLRVPKRSVDGNVEGGKDIGKEQVIFDLQQFLPKNIGDGPGSVQSPRGKMRNCGVESVANQSKFKNSENVRMEGMKNLGTKKRPSSSPSRTVKSERDIAHTKRPSRHELKALSTTFEEILKTCNVFKQNSKEHMLKQDIPVECPQNSRGKESNTNICERKLEQGDQKSRGRNQDSATEETFYPSRQRKMTDNRKPTLETSSTNGKENFNLFEYALRNLKDSTCDSSDSPPARSSPSRAPNLTLDKVNMFPSEVLLNEELPDILFNFQDISVSNKKSLTVLNDTRQSKSPKRVNEMFKRLSRESLRSPEDGKSYCDFDDSKTFIKFIDNDNFSDENGREYSNRDFIEGCEDCEEHETVKMASSSDSIILTDEEFERQNRNSCLIWSKGVSVDKERRKKNNRSLKGDRTAQEIPHSPLKSHPLKLTDKDRNLADQKVLKTIGLFTEKGEFRPGVISILEEKQRMCFTQNSPKNVQFRSERKFDVKLQYNCNDTVQQTEKQPSREESLGSCSESNTSVHSSAVTLSSSTVSDSDLLSMEPNNDQTVIKRSQ